MSVHNEFVCVGVGGGGGDILTMIQIHKQNIWQLRAKSCKSLNDREEGKTHSKRALLLE